MIIENREREVLKTSRNLVNSSINQSSLMKNKKIWEKNSQNNNCWNQSPSQKKNLNNLFYNR